MKEELLEKLELIKKINTDDSNFILKVFESYQKNEERIEEKKSTTTIILNNQNINIHKHIINLDEIWVKPYFYTKMRVKLDGIITQIYNTNKFEILTNPTKFCNKVIFHKLSKNFEKTEQELDIIQFIQSLDERKKTNPKEKFDFTFIAKEIDEETLFKEEQIKKAIEIIEIDDNEKRNEKIYEEIYNYLKQDFVSNNYCDFHNNKCVAQRNHTLYPINKKNGCCFKLISTCNHLKNGNCTVECLACRLFSCPYLTKRGIGYWANEFILLKAFYTKQQRKHVVHDFFQPKQKVLKKICKEMYNI